MKLAIFSDIHANREAFDACWKHSARHKIDRVVCLGDLVGYGADPQYLVDRMQRLLEEGAIILRGNHDEAAVTVDTAGMNDYARLAIEWTARMLDKQAIAFLQALPMSVADETIADCLFVHAEGSDPHDWRYIHDAGAAERSLQAVAERITFCGHVHVPQLYNMGEKQAAHLFTPKHGEPVPLVGRRQWLAVMGATGQPRDRNPAACYAIYDTDTNELTYYRVPYDIEAAAAKIHGAGLPNMLAARLFVGR
ncbi:MAG: metallophosphoesterase family protein [Hyphomicrobiales bacterium]|nr:metallophosphoesterase family protein [Hyphomicrobiales bacterium]